MDEYFDGLITMQEVMKRIDQEVDKEVRLLLPLWRKRSLRKRGTGKAEQWEADEKK